jgi:serine O-acetyltransferase
MIHFIPDKKKFYTFLSKRLNTVDLTLDDIQNILDSTLDNIYKRFSLSTNKYYFDENNNICLRVAHNSQICIFLYELSRNAYLQSLLYKEQNNQNESDKYKLIADKLYYLNITDTSTNLMYDNKLPLRLHCEHTLGTIVGRAKFSDDSSLLIYQGCTIGGNISLEYPTIDGNLIMYSNSALIGNIQIKGTVVLGHGCSILDGGLIENKLVFGKSPNLIFKDIKKNYVKFK